MLDALRFWRYYRYPSYQWAVCIRQILDRMPLDAATLIDAPCGDGVISYWLIQYALGQRYELYDLSARAVEVSRRMLTWRAARRMELVIERRDIHQLPVEGPADDVWLLINSLYLLPDIDRLLDRMRPRAQTIIAVFPNTTSANYRLYTAQSPSTNIHAMGHDETIGFFARHGYSLDEEHELCYVPLYSIQPGMLRLAASFLVNPVAGLYPKKEACYWLAVFSRAASQTSSDVGQRT
jgi:hypothetical protein